MEILEQRTANDYQILVEPLDGPVTARRGDTVIARSDRAKVMYETRLPPVIYFPREDVIADLVPAPDHRTFCPFKGTASYADLKIGDTTLKNAVWCYENALPEGRAVDGYVAFMPDTVTDYELSGLHLHASPSGNISGPTVDWLLREAWTLLNPEDLTAAIGRRLVEDGIAVSRFSVLIWSLHPMIAGRHYIWTRTDNHVKVASPSHGIFQNPAFVNSPLQHVSNGLGGVRQRLDANPDEFNFPIMEDLRAQGATDYVAMPLPFSNGQINVLTMASDHPDGFTTANLGLVFECAPMISRLYEVFALRSNATALLETYLGKRTGARVLGGEIRRGDGDVIEAAILFCDLRGSTRLESELSRPDYVALLNRFFEVTTDLINENDGEVLKFIGDAVLAIFPATDDRAQACSRAVSSARRIVETLAAPDEGDQPKIQCAIGIAFGEVTYGNVGSRERLDFTVIGSAANVAARLGDHGKRTGHPIVVAEDVCQDPERPPLPLGRLELHNVRAPVEAFAVQVGS
ncbi:adenylate/guanylate cyclase [Roseibium hamelinense]|uniref:Adenylate/guanylate cyclase n=1 Tax=Roseibium hamelinense TaxID=150831 RepID=A0A562T9T5_9HYPH|nr:DUF427 domain-containing protein [Roseibium hamelinense]MTI45182.1 DUF427 domain-containing protein [Roseibium hamelinense]TWI90457.1 adenylate/guanylate cyclase [Roseibium hamelinense]